jgi:hypothetical protein
MKKSFLKNFVIIFTVALSVFIVWGTEGETNFSPPNEGLDTGIGEVGTTDESDGINIPNESVQNKSEESKAETVKKNNNYVKETKKEDSSFPEQMPQNIDGATESEEVKKIENSEQIQKEVKTEVPQIGGAEALKNDLPEISFDDLELGSNSETDVPEVKDAGDKVLKGVVAWALVLAGIAMMVSAIVGNRKIPKNTDIKISDKHGRRSSGKRSYVSSVKRNKHF